ncbi:MAG: phosphodiester glycosidase family protein [Ruminococcus sp.]|nr:phosphodiester glycosidase family protein [Ruminococcus sp.]
MKKSKVFSRTVCVLLVVMMAFSALPFAASAYNKDFVSSTHDTFSRKTSTIAPGVTQDICYAYNKEGKQIVYYVATADINDDTVNVYANYKDNQCESFGMSKLTEQMASAQAKHSNPDDADNYIEYYNVVAGVNADFYNMTTGQPSGAFVMEGKIVNNANNRPFFAILDDGTAVIGANNTDWNKYKEHVTEAVGGSLVLVKDGADVTASASGDYNTDRHSRTCVGITAEGEVVMMVLDGRQEPFSAGGSMHELAQIMLEAGCVSAINLDGGGSTTFAAKQEGENSVTIVNRPSDGSERSISSSLMIVSTAVPSNTFDHATLTASDEYVTPNSTVKISAKGVSPAGTAADVPEDISWQLADSSFGTVDNGVFTSTGKTGDAVVQMVYNGNVVGEVTIHVVIPTGLSFNSEVITVPYGKTTELKLTAICNNGLNTVTTKAEDFKLTLSDEKLGTIDGLSFKATDDEDITEGTITATIVGTEISAKATINIGKGSETVFNFEDGTENGFGLKYSNYNYYLPNSNVYVADAENGQVHSGDYSLALNIDYSNSLESGYQMISLYQKGTDAYFENAKTLGMWMYIPDECVSLWARWMVTPIASVNEDGTYTLGTSSITGQTVDGTINGQTGYVYTFQESGWHYISIDLSAYKGVAIRDGYYMFQFYISDRDGASFDYYFKNQHNVNGNYTFYIDDITIDYSSVVDDREAPVFSSVLYADEIMSDAVELKGQTTNYNTLSFSAKFDDNKTKTNYSGIDYSTAKAYIDGVDFTDKAKVSTNGTIALEDITLADGEHTVKFSVCDNVGNYGSAIRKINVQSNSNMPTIKLAAHDSSLKRIPLGSIYYVDIVATDIEKVKEVSTTLDLDNMSKWELDHMEVAKGFEATYKIAKDDNIATITIKRTGNSSVTGEAALVSMPIRAWELSNPVTTAAGKTWDYAAFKASKECWPIFIDVQVDRGLVTFTDDTTSTFTGDSVVVDTEMWANYSNMTSTEEGKAYWNSWNGGHTHTAKAVDDKAPTCTSDGYTGRTFCDNCNSVIEWGTAVPATGHTYEFIDDVLKCKDCGELFNGTYTDGKEYQDGVIVSDGWHGNYYYVNGEKLTGIQLVDEDYYDFGEDGVSQGKYTGFYEQSDGWYYITAGKIAKGWQYIDDNYYYFDPDTGLSYYGKKYYIYSQSYSFNEKGMLESGLWVKNPNGEGTMYYYGPSRYQRTWAEIDGNTYYFDINGIRKEGICCFVAGINGDSRWYEFTDEGALVRIFDETGIYENNGNLYYLINGVNQHGLFKVDKYYYYFNSSTYTAVKGRYWVEKTNGLLEKGYYEFAEDGKMIRDEDKNGLYVEADGTYYYVDGQKTYAGLVLVDGSYYYFNSGLKAVTGRYWVEKTNGLMDKGYYEFDENGKMIRDEDKNGLYVEEDGTYYYVNGKKTYAGLVLVDGSYYYFNSTLKAVTGRYWVEKTNGLMDKGYYVFAEDGKMIRDDDKNGLYVEEDGTYYYVDGQKTYAGLVYVDGSYYYINSTLKAVTGRYWVEKTNGLMEKGFYEFAEDGKMIREEDKNGLYVEEDGTYYYVDGQKIYAGLVYVDGSYYYINSTLKAVTGRYWVEKTNDLMPKGFYNFDQDGKMIVS